MSTKKPVRDIIDKVMSKLPERFSKDSQAIKRTMKDALHATLSKMELVTREDFDTQKGLLKRLEKKLTALEKQLADMEKENKS